MSINNRFLAIRKESGMTSNDVVEKVRVLLNDRTIKVGHTGTLDPLAKGVLILGIGEATKFSSFVVNKDKKYRVEIVFGYETDTNDADGKIIAEKHNSILVDLSKDNYLNLLKTTISKNLLGKIQQLPPRYSAIKVNGRKLYQYARQNVDIQVAKRKVEIYSFIVDKKSTIKKSFFDIHCSKGTYIRSLARDLGYLLNTYAYVTSLNRTEVDNVKIEDAITIDELKGKISETSSSSINNASFTIEELLPTTLQKVSVESKIMDRLLHGQRIYIGDIKNDLKHIKKDEDIAVYCNDTFIGICWLDDELLRPKRMMKSEFIKRN